MIKKSLYRYEEDNNIIYSLEKPLNKKYTSSMIRLIAEPGKVLTRDGINYCSCIDVFSEEGWYEISLEKEKDKEESVGEEQWF